MARESKWIGNPGSGGGGGGGSPYWGDAVNTAGDLPASGVAVGEIRQAVDTGILYIWDGSAWVIYLDPNGLAHIPVDLSSEVTGILPVANGGTGSATGFTDQQAEIDAIEADIVDLQAEKLDLAGGTMTGPLNLAVAIPTGAFEAAPKSYVDSVAQGLNAKGSAVAATTANIALTGIQTIDGVVLVAGDRVLVKDQTLPAENGIYLASAGAWSRAPDLDIWSEVSGAFVFITGGTVNGSTGWVSLAPPSGTIGTDPIVFTQFSGAGTYKASGSGIELVGTVFSLELDGTSLSVSPSGLKVADNGIANQQISPTAGIEFSKMEPIDPTVVVVTDSFGNIVPSGIAVTELNMLSGIDSNIQDQIDDIWNNPTLDIPVIGGRGTPPQAGPVYVEGMMYYDSVEKVMRYYNDSRNGDTVAVGQEIVAKVWNGTGATLNNGDVIRIASFAAGLPSVVKAQANSSANARVFGVVTESIPTSNFGYVTISGRVKNLSILGPFAIGDLLFLSPTVAGGLTNVRPVAPNYAYPIGSVADRSANGILILELGAFQRLGLGGANQVRGVNVDATDEEYKTLFSSQINYCGNPNRYSPVTGASAASLGWFFSGGTPTTITTGLPRDTWGSGIQYVTTAAGQYLRYRFKADAGDAPKRLQVLFSQIATFGDFRLRVYRSSDPAFAAPVGTEILCQSIYTDTSGVTSLPTGTLDFLANFDTTTDLYYEVRWEATGDGIGTLKINGVDIGPGGAGNGTADKSSVIAGTIEDYAGDVSTWPTVDGIIQKDGWALCDGKTFTASQYPDLAAALGTKWAACKNPLDNSTYTAPGAGIIRLPDLRGAFLRGTGGPNMGGVTTALADFQLDATAPNGLGGTANTGVNLAHGHPITDPGHVHETNFGRVNLTAGAAGQITNDSTTNYTRAGGATSNTTGISVNNSTSLDHSHGLTINGGGPETRPDSIGVNRIIKLWNAQPVVVVNPTAQSPIRAGTIMPFAGATVPAGWLDCDGMDYEKAQYPQLYEQLQSGGTNIWDTGPRPLTGGSWTAPSATRFRVPDLRSAFVRGQSNVGQAPNGANAAGVTTSRAGYQADTTAQNGLATTGSAPSLTGTTTFAANGHIHSAENSAGANNMFAHFDFGTASVFGTSQSGTSFFPASTRGYTATTNPAAATQAGAKVTGNTTANSSSASVGISGGSWALNAGDAETRPDNVGLRYIIKAFDESFNMAGFAEASITRMGMVSGGRVPAAPNGTAVVAGNINQNFEVSQTATIPPAGNGVLTTILSHVPPAGKWRVDACFLCAGAAAGQTYGLGDINEAAVLRSGPIRYTQLATSGQNVSGAIAPYFLDTDGTKTMYLLGQMSYSTIGGAGFVGVLMFTRM